jgi:hypothetical protein
MRFIRIVSGCVLASLFESMPAAAQPNPEDFVREVMNDSWTTQKAAEVIANLGLNCGDESQWGVFLNELYKALKGLAAVMSEAELELAMKKDYPTVCHVLTTAQLNAYKEGSEQTHSNRCLAEDGFGGCLIRESITTDSPRPEYYWPKYFVEVNEKGNDSHATFAANNGLYTTNRRLAHNLQAGVDINGALKLTSLVLGGKQMLGTIGMDTGPVDAQKLAEVGALTPFEAMRVRANADKTQPSYEVNIWPVALSEAMAEHFTVCGPQLKDQGKSPGGYTWPAKGVPMTCPVAMSRDAMHFWDTGMLDYLDPQAVGQMGAASNPMTCGAAAAMDAMGGMGEASRDGLGDKTQVNNSTSSLSGKIRQGVLGCSWPILGNSEALMSKAMSTMDAAKWQGPYCTLWGSLAPRMSTAVYQNDYGFANAGLKFKTMSHELFGVPRGAAERWSLAYPWEGPGSSVDGAGRGAYFAAFKAQIDGALKAAGLDSTAGVAPSRAEGLFRPGDPIMLDASYTSKAFADQTGNRVTELGYIASLGAASVAAREAAVRRYRQQNGTGQAGESAVAAAAAASPWVAAEVKRASDGNLKGQNIVGGDRRIYTVWEKIQCTSESKRMTINQGGIETHKYESCQAAIRFEVYKYIQLELVRKACDWMRQPVGKPWR